MNILEQSGLSYTLRRDAAAQFDCTVTGEDFKPAIHSVIFNKEQTATDYESEERAVSFALTIQPPFSQQNPGDPEFYRVTHDDSTPGQDKYTLVLPSMDIDVCWPQ